jgi:protein SCO1
MKFTFARGLALLATCGLALATPGCREKMEPDQAGYAYTETESGELLENRGALPTGSTLAPPKRVPAGSEAEWLTAFELIERSGESMTSEDLLGQPYVVSFFFSLCPSICVQQNEKVQILAEKFAGQPVRFVSISCDPEVDRPEVLAEYADKFNADKQQWLFFTGEMNYIRRVGSEMFSLPVMRRFHAEKFVLVDSAGKLHAYYTWTDPEQWQGLQRDIAKIIEAGGKFDAATR